MPRHNPHHQANRNQNNTPPYPTVSAALQRAADMKGTYQGFLAEKEFLYVTVGNQEIGCIEVHFEKENYLHLTGLDYLSAETLKRTQGIQQSKRAGEFFNRLGTDSTLINDVSFITGNTAQETRDAFTAAQIKLQHLSELSTISKNADSVGTYQGNGNYGMVISRQGEALMLRQETNSDFYYPASSQGRDIHSVATDIKPVLAIFSRKKGDPEYHICYLNKDISFRTKLMTEELTSLLSPKSFILQDDIKVNQASLNALSETYTYSVLEHDFQKLFDLQKTVYEDECIDAYIQIQDKIENELRTIQQCNHAEKILERQEKLLDGADEDVKALFEETKHMVLRKKEKLEHGQTSVQVAELRIRIPDIGSALKNAASPANAAALSLWKDVTIRIPLPPKKPFQAIARKVREIAGTIAEKLNAVIRKPEQEVSSFRKEETLPDMTMENGSQVIANGDFCEEKQDGYAMYTSAESFNMNVEKRVEKKISTPEKPKETEELKEKDDQQQTSWQEEEQEENKSEYDDLS